MKYAAMRYFDSDVISHEICNYKIFWSGIMSHEICNHEIFWCWGYWYSCVMSHEICNHELFWFWCNNSWNLNPWDTGYYQSNQSIKTADQSSASFKRFRSCFISEAEGDFSKGQTFCRLCFLMLPWTGAGSQVSHGPWPGRWRCR